MIEENLRKIFDEIKTGNNFGEKIDLLGATKTVSIENINSAIQSGLEFIGENYAQEFRDKYPFYLPVKKFFIGTLQKNKLNYLVGKADNISSVTSYGLAQAISDKAERLNIVQDIMIEINGGEEIQKTGVYFDEVIPLYRSIIGLKNIRITGITAMLPISTSDDEKGEICRRIRDIFNSLRKENENIRFLSVGTTGDYKIAIKNGSNMIRIGEGIFGKRIYKEK